MSEGQDAESENANIQTKAGFAAVIGAPNAGKSTLVNRLVGSKVSIVTQKVQTTRFPVRGVAMHGAAQIVLVDTPGIFTPRRRLDRAMVRSAWGGSKDADVTVHMVDAQAQWAHMNLEEGTILPAARKHLTEQDWLLIYTAFSVNGDPRFDADLGDGFKSLYSRIMNQAAK